MPLRTTARITALRPGQSPPPVSTPMRMVWLSLMHRFANAFRYPTGQLAGQVNVARNVPELCSRRRMSGSDITAPAGAHRRSAVPAVKVGGAAEARGGQHAL